MNCMVPFTCLLVAVFTADSLADETDKPPPPDQERLFEIVNAIRVNEARYHNLETVVRIKTRWEIGSLSNVRQQEETRHTIEQRELFWFHQQGNYTLASGEKIKRERLAAFDGEFTRSIEFGNSVNVHTGRHEPARMVPPHGWSVFQLRISSLPLSVYLSGTTAIREHPKAFQSPGQQGRTFDLARVETEIEGEEIIDGLKCIKLRNRCWHRDKESPTVELLWLAPERNYLCIGSQWFVESIDRWRPLEVSKVVEMRELEPGLWLPMRVEVRRGKRDAQSRLSGAVESIETWTVEKAASQSKELPERLSDVKLPADLPRFDIGEDGRLDTSGLELVEAKPRDPRELAAIIEKLREQERRYGRIDVSLATTCRTFEADNIGVPGIHLGSEQTERTVAMPGKLYHASQLTYRTAGHGDYLMAETSAWDGQWLRSLHWQAKGRAVPAQPTRASIGKHGLRGMNAFRPHTAMFWRQPNWHLSELLTAQWYDEQNKYGYQVSYIGDDKIDGFACKLLRLGDVSSGQGEPYRFTFLWLAPERNYLPIRSERCDLTCSETLPTGSTQVAEWQELKPGVWLPSQVIALAYDQSGRYGIGSGQILVQVREDRHVERATVDVSVSEDLFAPAAPAGKVSVVDAMGHTIGEIRQRQPGPATVPDEKWRLMTATGPHDVESLIQRQTARKALIGRPAPPLVGERWLNGEPRTWDALAGNVVILFFWAEWAADLQDELAQLAVACPELAEAGIQVIGVHPAGSTQVEIEEANREFKITWPVCIDRAHPDGHLWGSLCESLQVEYLPSAFVIDAQAKIAAQGRLAEMIAKARELAKKP